MKENFGCLSTLICRLVDESQTRICPAPYREFLSEIARCTPACGLLQLGDEAEEVTDILRNVASKSIDVQSSVCHQKLSTLLTNAPVITNFICKCPKISGHLPDDVCAIISHVLDVVAGTYADCSTHPASSYAVPSTNHLSHFPSLPVIRGTGRYSADQHTRTADEHNCRKVSYGHPTLTPGIFTLYCTHGICYGFEVMRRCESPQVPFSIFTSRFPTPPKTIVYDNACKLHVYCLNREPALYRSTRFFVDRFYWKGHIGCSKGYSLDSYPSVDIKRLNSQVNEQAQRIRAQLAYMKPDNFVFTLSLFLSIINTDKMHSLDISTVDI